MADESAVFAIELEGNIKGASAEGSEALEKLRSRIDGAQKHLSALNAAQKRLQGGTHVNVAAFKELQARIEKQKQAIAEAQSQYISLGGSFGPLKKKTEGAAGGLRELLDSVSSAPGPLGQLGGSISKAVSSLASLPGVALLVAAAVAAVTVALLAGAAALLKFGIASADARRNEELHLEALTHMRNRFGIAAGSATELQGAIDRVAGSSATSRGQIAAYAEQLYRGGLRGENLSLALQGAATRAAALGDESGRTFASLAVGANRAGVSVRRLADDVQARFGGVAARRLLSLDVMSEKLHENFAGLFAGLNIDGMLTGLKSLMDMFSQNTASGRALKQMITGFFQPLIDGIGIALPIVRHFFLNMIIAALETRIALRRLVRSAIDIATAFSGLGARIIDGLVNGIRAGYGRARGAITGLGDTLTEAFRSALDIHSPSRVFAQVGLQIPRGVAAGVDAGAPAAAGSVADMMDATAPDTDGAGVAPAARASNTIERIEVHIHTDSREPAEHARRFVEELTQALEGFGVMMGAARGV